MTFSRRLPALITLVIIVGAARLPEADAQPSQPNVIFVMVDDAGVGDFSSYTPSTPVQTPNLDALAADGLRFTNAYAGSTVCAPSRSALMTGQHMGHTRVRGNYNSMLHDADVTIAEVLKTAGYATGGFGKWGTGMPGTTGAPERQGFDTFVGYYNQVHAHSQYPTHLYHNGQRLDIPENVGFSEPETGLVSNSRVMAHNLIVDHMHDFIAENAQSGTPFFAYGAWTPPHRKSTMPQAEANPGGAYAPYATMAWPEQAKIQAAFITMIDRQVGNIVAQVKNLGIADNTLILFASDNGGWETSSLNQAYDRNEGLRGSKTSMYEGGLRTPLVAFWDGQITGGTTSDILTYFPDLMPTFAELAGASAAVPDDTDGISIVPTLVGDGPQSHHSGLYFESTSNTGDPNSSLRQSVRMGDWKLIRNGNGSLELYSLATDLEETTNVQASNPGIVAQLTAFMNANHDPMYPQFRADGAGGVTGVVQRGIRPGVIANRNWSIAASGDAQSISDPINDEFGDSVGLYVDDLHQAYQLELTVDRTGAADPVLTVEVRGATGTAYYTGLYDTSQQGVGTTVDVMLDLEVMGTTPSQSTLTSDLGGGLLLRIRHSGGAGDVLVSDVQFAGGPMLADLDFDDDIDRDDWAIQRYNMFSDVSALTALEAYEVGDLNADGFNNEFDFFLFRKAYDNANGTGAFDGMLAGVPEPATWMLLTIAGAWAAALLRRPNP